MIAGLIASSVWFLSQADRSSDGQPARSAKGYAVVTVVADVGSDQRAVETIQGMADTSPDLHLLLGDLSYAGPDSADAWCKMARDRLGGVPVQIVAGNHEDDTGEDGHITAFEGCLPDRMQSSGRYGREYYFDIGRIARFIVISPDLTIDGEHYYYGDGNPHEQWLRSAIDDARTRGVGWVVVGMHKNCLSVGEYYCNAYQDLLDLLVEKRVDLVLHGHEHTYQRSKQVSTANCPQVVIDKHDPECVVDDGSDGVYSRGAGPVFVVTGAGGGELYDVNMQDPEAGYFAAVMGRNEAPTHGFSTLGLTSHRLEVSFVPSSDGGFSDVFVIR